MNEEAKKEGTRYRVPEELEIGPGKEPEKLPEIPIPREKIRTIVEQLDFYVTKYEEAAGASEQCMRFRRMTESLNRAKGTPLWTDMVGHCSDAYGELSKAYQGNIETWQSNIPDCPEIEPYVKQYKDRLDRVDEAIYTLPSLFSDSDTTKTIGTLSQCSKEMREKSQKICSSLLDRIRTLVKELNKLLPEPKPTRKEKG